MATADGLIVSVSGIRGVVGRSLTPAVALAFASALGTHVGGGRVVVSRDGRPSGAMLRHAVLAGLTAAGCEVHDLGVDADADGRPGRADAPGGRRRADHRQPQPGRVERPETVRPGRPRTQRRRGPEDPGAVRVRRRRRPCRGTGSARREISQGRGRSPRARPGTGGRGRHPGRRVQRVPRRQRRRRRAAWAGAAEGRCSAETICHGCVADGGFLHEPEPTRGICARSARWCRGRRRRRLRPRPRRRPAGADRRERAAISARN